MTPNITAYVNSSNSTQLYTDITGTNNKPTSLAGVWPILFIFILTFNGALLTLILTTRHLITSFTIYLICILASNLICWCVCMLPLEMMNFASTEWWMGQFGCDIYLYGNWVLPGVITGTHALMSLTRIWAVFAPVSYRIFHNPRLAMYVCVALWIVIHVASLPLIIRDHLFFRLPLNTGCRFNIDAQEFWSQSYIFLVFYVPDTVVLCTYPFICYKYFRNSRHHAKLVAPDGKKGPVFYRSKSFVALTAMTVSIMVLWAPYHVMSILEKYYDVVLPPVVWQLEWIGYPVQAVMDPILFALCLAAVRKEIKRHVANAKDFAAKFRWRVMRVPRRMKVDTELSLEQINV